MTEPPFPARQAVRTQRHKTAKKTPAATRDESSPPTTKHTLTPGPKK